ncbi:MAG: GNAT family N-acetyltransferase [Nitrospira sp.]|nr:GNAT family N-acetyltransferase [Nitrospira sp.]
MEALFSGNAQRSNLAVSIAKSPVEVREAQRLRHHVFVEECGARLPHSSAGIDEDEFDPYCDHLIVRDTRHHMVVGTYRILTSWKAQEVGRFYSESEFDLTNLKPLTPRLVEVGRSCIHADYRQGAVITLLWAGLAQYMIAGGYEYLMGCASISLSDGGEQATATYLYLRERCLSPLHWRVIPHRPYPLAGERPLRKPTLPPLVKGYVRLGAFICGEPAWDQQFNTADLFMLLPLAQMDARYARHFFGAPCGSLAPAV